MINTIIFKFFQLSSVHDDLQADHESKAKLLSDMEDLSQALINLALTGRATPYIHNGELLYDKKGELMVSVIKNWFRLFFIIFCYFLFLLSPFF